MERATSPMGGQNPRAQLIPMSELILNYPFLNNATLSPPWGERCRTSHALDFLFYTFLKASC